jgi:hypothetical protein
MGSPPETLTPETNPDDGAIACHNSCTDIEMARGELLLGQVWMQVSHSVHKSRFQFTNPFACESAPDGHVSTHDPQ